jgi:MATE family, multidrug efflux pump
MTMEASADTRPPATPAGSLLTSPILPTLLKLALPNAIAMFGTALVAVAETSYIGRLGVEPLAGIALVFPFVMLTQMMSTGAMGGGVSSAVSRALGSGNRERAANLALHAAIIGIGGGLLFTAVMLVFGRVFYALLGGRGEVLEQAMHYSQVLLSGAVSIWLVNTLASVVRGTGDMRVPSLVLIGVAIIQVIVGGGLGARAVRPAQVRNARRRRRTAHSVHAGRTVPRLVSRQRPQPAQAQLQKLRVPA